MSVAKQFSGLPIEDLILSPLIGMAKGQAKLNEVTWDYISTVAFEPLSKDDKSGKVTTRSLDLELSKYVTNEDGEQKLQKINSKIPMLPLVPLPSLAITKADIEFTMEVKSSTASKVTQEKKAEVKAKASGGFFGQKYEVSVSGSVSTNKENTRSTDNSAKYNVKVHAEQLPATEGMLKLSDMLNTLIEPSVVEAPKQQGQGG